ncbi:MAG: sulfatase-like hydrolase/transferase [Deltaproteobacteria bacterium]|nr:sulfatase-like hydrolase/transferase [Deltaproteobacteria bacterium]
MKTSSLPHIILIVLDTAGAKRCSAYGYPRETTPGLSRLAEEATLYKYCFAPAPWTIPSHASLFSGLYPSQHGCNVYNREIPDSINKLPEFLRQMGYRSMSITSNLLVSPAGFEQVHGMNQLFNSPEFIKARKAIDDFKKKSKSDLKRLQFLLKYIIEHNFYTLPIMSLIDKYYRKYFGKIKIKSLYATERTFFLAKRLFKKYADDHPLFIFINCMETHWQYYPPAKYLKSVNIKKDNLRQLQELDYFDMYVNEIPEYLLEALARLYEQELMYATDKVWDFYRFLKNSAQQDRTLFIATSDHGESLGERGLWGHNFGVYNEVIHIPLVVKYPKDIGLQGESDRVVQLHDLWATIMEMIESPLPGLDSSKSLLSERRNFAFCENQYDIGVRAIRRRHRGFSPTGVMQACRCVIDADFMKLIEWQDGRLEYYDIKNDYDERHNLASSPDRAQVVGTLQAKLNDYLGPFTWEPDPEGWGLQPKSDLTGVLHGS